MKTQLVIAFAAALLSTSAFASAADNTNPAKPAIPESGGVVGPAYGSPTPPEMETPRKVGIPSGEVPTKTKPSGGSTSKDGVAAIEKTGAKVDQVITFPGGKVEAKEPAAKPTYNRAIRLLQKMGLLKKHDPTFMKHPANKPDPVFMKHPARPVPPPKPPAARNPVTPPPNTPHS